MEKRNNRLFAIAAISFTFILSVSVISIIYSNRNNAYLDDMLVGVIFLLSAVFVLLHFLWDSLELPAEKDLKNGESLNNYLNEIDRLKKEVSKLKDDQKKWKDKFKENPGLIPDHKKSDFGFEGNYIYDSRLVCRSIRLHGIRRVRDEIKSCIIFTEISGENYKTRLDELYSEYDTLYEDQKKRDPDAIRLLNRLDGNRISYNFTADEI